MNLTSFKISSIIKTLFRGDLMNRKRIINAVVACVLVLTVSSMPSGVIKAEKATQINQASATSALIENKKDTINTENSPTDKTTSVDKQKAVTLDNSTIEKYKEPNDTFYEPENESVTVLDDSSAYINDAVTVFFKEDANEEDKREIVKSLDGEIVGQIDFMNEYEIKTHKSDIYGLQSVCDELMKDDAVEFASCSIADEITENYVPNDPWGNYADWEDAANDKSYSNYNWWIKATDIDKAWDYNDQFSKINIGIVDSGFNTEHEDLENRISFANNFFAKNNYPDSHGTHVAGIIGAIQDNEKGISGVVRDCNLICADWQANEEGGQKWNSEARIMSGFVNTVRAGAKVINFSLGSSGDIANGTTNRYKIIKDVEAKYTSYFMAKLISKGYDFICCQSAGNGTTLKDDSFYAVDASNNGSFCTITKDNAIRFVDGVTPQDIVDRIIIVASAQFNGYNTYVQSSFSNGGSQVSICAPGSRIYSTYYTEDGGNNSYAILSGTSMAAPIVTGIASMVWSINQNFTGADVKHFVCDVENTKYLVADSPSETHLPTGEIPMVNAQLAVEVAIKATENDGTVSGKIQWSRLSTEPRISIKIVNKDSGKTYRVFTDANGDFIAKLPQGEYTLNVNGKQLQKFDFTVTAQTENNIGTVNVKGFFLDIESYTQKIKTSLQDLWAFMYIY